MSSKKILIKVVVGILLAAVLAGGIYYLSMGTKKDEHENFIVHSASWEDVTKIEVVGEEEFSLVKDDTGWVMEGFEDIEVNNVFADTLAKSMCNITSPMVLEEDVKEADCGLDNPAATVKIEFKTGDCKIKVGKQSGEFYYVKAEGKRDIYLVNKEDLYMMFLGMMKYLDNTVFSIEEDVKRVEFNGIVLTSDGTDWFEEMPYTQLADKSKVEAVVEKIKHIDAQEIITKDDDIELGEPVYVKLELADGETAEFEAYQEGYIRLKDGEYLYRVAGEEIDFTAMTGFDFLAKYVAPVAINEVSKIELVNGGTITTLSIEAPSGEAPVFYKNGVEAKEESFRLFYQNLVSLTVTGEGFGEGAVERAVVFTKENGELYTVEFMSLSQIDYCVRINRKDCFIINKKAVSDVFEAVKSIETV